MAVNSFNAQNPPVTTKGDVFTFSTIPTRLGVGANNTVLTADSSTATGLKWATPAGGANWTLLNSGGTALTGAQIITVSGISGADQILVYVTGASAANAGSDISIRINADASNYVMAGGNSPVGAQQDTNIVIGSMSNNAGSLVSGYALISGGNAAGVKVVTAAGGATAATGSGNLAYFIGGYYNSSSTVSSVSVRSSSGNLDNGSVYVFTTA